MDVEKIALDRTKARELWREYRKHQHYEEPVDEAIRRTYQLIAQGHVVIKALESIRLAGVDAEGLPKLAIVRADADECWCELWMNGSARFAMDRYAKSRGWRRYIDLPHGTFPARQSHRGGYTDVLRAVVPIIPIHLRPKRGLANYHILWEADWERIPSDPMLLRRIGRGDLWLVVAAWDLTEVERAALATRVSS
jgi:hypothetical protein